MLTFTALRIALQFSRDVHSFNGRQRDPNLLQPIVLCGYWKGLKRFWRTEYDRHRQKIYLHLKNTRVHCRAWVLQERLLSPRDLHFGMNMIYWECRRVLAPEGKTVWNQKWRNFMFTGIPENDLSMNNGYLGRWCHVIKEYTAAKLTIQIDKLVTISALAKEMQKHVNLAKNSEIAHLAGLWLSNLEIKLL